jgi:hypothetical protein
MEVRGSPEEGNVPGKRSAEVRARVALIHSSKLSHPAEIWRKRMPAEVALFL